MKKKLTLIFLFFFILTVIFLFLDKPCKKKDYSVCKLNINNNQVYLKVAYSKEAQAKGLMNVNSLKEDEGMIFVYDESKFLSFWMKNTLIPLSIAYLDESGKVIAIYNMSTVSKDLKDEDLPIYTSPSKAKYAIEMNKAWFSLRGIKTGSYIDIPEVLK